MSAGVEILARGMTESPDYISHAQNIRFERNGCGNGTKPCVARKQPGTPYPTAQYNPIII